MWNRILLIALFAISLAHTSHAATTAPAASSHQQLFEVEDFSFDIEQF
jgi:hypothetical protein